MPLAGLAGGLLIGAAGAVLLLGLGRIAGVSGLAARAVRLSNNGPPVAVAAAFALGLPLGAWLFARIGGPIETHFPPSWMTLAVGGLLVGLGTRLGGGCTSGHGVCGLSRLSVRSIVATLTFMATGVLTVALVRVLGVSR